MKKRVDSSLVEFILKNWNDSYRGEEVQEIIEAIVAELKQDYRDYCRRESNPEVEACFEGLICDVQTIEFWMKFDYLSRFNFDY